jgi:hypothetical protein
MPASLLGYVLAHSGLSAHGYQTATGSAISLFQTTTLSPLESYFVKTRNRLIVGFVEFLISKAALRSA